ELREKTGAGLMDCKKALSETQGDFSKAIDFLKRQGILKAAKKSDRVTKEGLVMEAVDSKGSSASLVEVNCETDFVARTDDFQNYVSALAGEILKTKPASLEALQSVPFSGQTVDSSLKALIARLGENIGIRRFKTVQAEGTNQKVAVYVHGGNKIGAIVRMEGKTDKLTPEVLKEVAMHVVAMNPQFLDGASVPEEISQREKANIKASPELKSKPAEMVDKIVEGKYRKFLSEICLLDQMFIKDTTGKNSVQKSLQGIDSSLKVLQFVRYQVGEEA
ncbi:MAG: translation elongation factor Ts, partial [bacterium]|nr:translation elongation factor Ts [bacterium]